MEHLQRFGLARDPFRNEPQLDFWFESAATRAARQRLVRCLRQRKALCILVGDVGAGTTTLARLLIEELEPELFEVGMLVVGRGVEPAWLRGAVARQLGIAEPAGERAQAMRQLYERLVEIREEGRHAVVAIDEAQMLAGSEALAELLALLNFEYEESFLLSAVLVGSPELERALAREPALLGRVELRVRLEPLGEEEARAYLAHRIEVAGGDPALLPDEVAAAIAARAGGLPRRMNALADNALFEAHLAERAHPSLADVERAAADLPWARSSDETVSGLAPVALAGDDKEEVPAPLEDPDEDTLDRHTRAAATAALAGYEVPELEAAPAAARAEAELERALVADGRERRRMARGGVAVPMERTARGEEFDAEVLAPAEPDQTEPGAWRRAQPAAEDDDTAGSREGLPAEDEIDDLFVDLVDEG